MSDSPIKETLVERKGAKCNNCGWKGHASKVDSSFTPLGQDGFGKECDYWRCPACGEEAVPITLDDPVDIDEVDN